MVGRQIITDPFEVLIDSADGVTWKAYVEGGRIFCADKTPLIFNSGMTLSDISTWKTLASQNQMLYLEYVPQDGTASIQGFAYPTGASGGTGPVYQGITTGGTSCYNIPLERILFESYTGGITGVGGGWTGTVSGIAPSQRDRVNFGDVVIASSTAGDHPWKSWVRNVSGTLYWSVSERHPDLAFTLAGRVYSPGNGQTNCNKTAWTSIGASSYVYLKLSIAAGAVTPSITTVQPTTDIDASPAILWYEIGYIYVISGTATPFQKLNADMDLSCALVPCWYSGYDASQKQYLKHEANAAPSWQNKAVCP
jgi:hypothetical protein